MNNKTKVVYVLTKSNEDLDITYPIGVFSNIDLAIKKVLDGVSDNLASFNTLLDFSKIAYSSNVSHASHSLNSENSDNGNTTYSKDIVDAVNAIFTIVVKNSLNEFDDEDISEELFSKVQNLIQNSEQYDQQDLYDEFLSYLYHWSQLFKQYDVVCDSSENIQSKIKQMTNDYQKLYVIKEFSDFDHISFKFEQLKQRYPNISFNQYSCNDNKFYFSINDYWNLESNNKLYNITRFVLDE